MNSKKVSIILPSYNDKIIIIPYYKAIIAEIEKQQDYDVEIIYVDDGSSDGSQDVLRDLAQQDSRVTFIELFCNFGQQRALIAGLMHSKGEYVVTLDGDYQYEPGVVFQLCNAMGDEYDMASGIRSQRKDSLIEIFLSKIGNILIRKVLGVPIVDFGSVKAFSRGLVLKVLEMQHRYADVYPSALSLRPRLVEVPVSHKKRYAGKSHWTVWKRIRLYFDLWIAYSNSSFQFFFKAGGMVMLLGLALMFIAPMYKAVLGHSATYFQILFIAFSTILLGFFISGWSLMMSLLTSIYKQNILNTPFVIRNIVKNTSCDDE